MEYVALHCIEHECGWTCIHACEAAWLSNLQRSTTRKNGAGQCHVPARAMCQPGVHGTRTCPGMGETSLA
eukprot:353638-Chlamydomonas_euryale.AAC.6